MLSMLGFPLGESIRCRLLLGVSVTSASCSNPMVALTRSRRMRRAVSGPPLRNSVAASSRSALANCGSRATRSMTVCLILRVSAIWERPPTPIVSRVPGTRSGWSRTLCGFHFHQFAHRDRARNWLPLLFEAFDMELNGLPNERKDLFLGFSGRDATRKVRNVSPIGGRAFFNNYEVSHRYHSCFFRPACFSALFSVPGGMSTLAFPDIVTVPVFAGC